MWINVSENKIYDGISLVFNNLKYFNPSVELLKKAGYVFIEDRKNKNIKNDITLQKPYEDAVQKYLDRIVQAKGYDNTYTCLSYIDSSNETWKREANIFNSYRDQVWLKCHEILNAFKKGEIEQPTITQVIEQLPKINWTNNQ